MARKATTNLSLGTWTQGENPGAGQQEVDNTGLNGNWIKIDTAIGAAHDASGNHRAGVIAEANLAATVVDGSTLEQDGSTKKLKIKADGVSTTQLANTAVTTAKLATDSVDATILKDDGSVDANRAVTTNHIRDANVTLAKLAADSVDATKITHDNNRTKAVFTISWTGTQVVTTYGQVNGQVLSSTKGIVMPRAGSLTGWAYCSSGGGCIAYTIAYGTRTFAAADRFAVTDDGGNPSSLLQFIKNGSNWFSGGISTNPLGAIAHLTLEVEFDD